jgi:hypothetical protein
VITGQYLDQRGFARPVVAEQPDDLALGDLDPYVVERQRAAETLAEMLRPQDRAAQ